MRAFNADGLGLLTVQCRAVLPSISTALKSHSAVHMRIEMCLS